MCWHPVEDHSRRQAVVAQHFDAVADLHHHPAVRRQDPRPLANLRAGRRVGPHQRHRLADRFLHHRRRGEQVEVEILLDDPDPAPGQRYRLGADLRRYVGEVLG